MAQAGSAQRIDVEVAGEAALAHGAAEALCRLVIVEEQVPGQVVEVGVHFVDQQRIAQLNEDHRQVSRATDVLSFPIDGLDEIPEGPPRQLGDIFVCETYVRRQLEEGKQISPDTDQDLETALARCVVHGMLHLLGYEHEGDDAAAEAMADREQQLLDRGLAG